MFVSSNSTNTSLGITANILEELYEVVVKVKKVRKWYLVSKLTRAFVESCLIMRLKTVKSFTLMKAIIKAVRELKELLSEEAKLIKIGMREAWKISEIASSWGHKDARNWRNNKFFILYQAITLKWLSRLFGRAIINEQ